MVTQGRKLTGRRTHLVEPSAPDVAELLREARRQAAVEERRRITRDLHDGVQQSLITLGVRIELAGSFIDDAVGLRLLLLEARADLALAVTAIRAAASGEAPGGLCDDGLRVALERSARRTPVLIDVQCADERFPTVVETCVYLCCSEAIQNVLRHADARHGSVRVLRDADRVRFEVSDDGNGFDPRLCSLGSGLRNLRDRVRQLGGEVTVSSAPGTGTTVRGCVRLTKTEMSRRAAT